MRKILIVVDMQNDFIDGSLGTKEAQEIVAENYFRPTNEKILKKHSDTFDLNINLANISDYGGWDKVQEKHFTDGGIFDQIYER